MDRAWNEINDRKSVEESLDDSERAGGGVEERCKCLVPSSEATVLIYSRQVSLGLCFPKYLAPILGDFLHWIIVEEE